MGLAERDEEEFDFATRLEELNEELETLNLQARSLEEQIAQNVADLLQASEVEDDCRDDLMTKRRVRIDDTRQAW